MRTLGIDTRELAALHPLDYLGQNRTFCCVEPKQRQTAKSLCDGKGLSPQSRASGGCARDPGDDGAARPPETRSDSFFWLSPVVPTERFVLDGSCQVHATVSLAQVLREAGGFQRVCMLIDQPTSLRLDVLTVLVRLLRLPRNLRCVLFFTQVRRAPCGTRP